MFVVVSYVVYGKGYYAEPELPCLGTDHWKNLRLQWTEAPFGRWNHLACPRAHYGLLLSQVLADLDLSSHR